MAPFLIVVGLLGYVVSAMTYLAAPTITQEIAAILVFTNATLFFVGGCIVSKLEEASAKRTVAPQSHPTPEIRGTGTTVGGDNYAAWADNLTKPRN